MERKQIANWTTGLKFILIFFIFSCQSVDSIKEFPIERDSFFHKVAQDSIDNFLLTGIVRLISSNNKDIYFSNFFAKGIFKMKNDYKNIHRVGKRGSGPGEYRVPFYIDMVDDTLYYSDIMTPLIKKMNIKGNQQRHTEYLSKMGGAKFTIDHNKIFSLWSGNPAVSIYDISTGNIIDTLINVNGGFSLFRRKVVGGAILSDDGGNVFVFPVQPYVMYVLSKRRNKYIVKNIYKLYDQSSTTIWDIGNNEKFNNSSFDEKERLLENVNYVLNAEIIGEKKKYIFIQLHNSSGYLYHLVSTDGKVVKEYHSKNLKLVGSDNIHLYFINETKNEKCESCTIIEKYKFLN